MISRLAPSAKQAQSPKAKNGDCGWLGNGGDRDARRGESDLLTVYITDLNQIIIFSRRRMGAYIGREILSRIGERCIKHEIHTNTYTSLYSTNLRTVDRQADSTG